jgi:membrane protein YdbS with pleckstrin-like domain
MFSLNLQPNEKLFKIYRQTEWVLAKTVLIIFAAIYIPAFLLVKNELLADFGKILIFWILIVLLYGIYNYILWLVNSYVVTDKRLVAVHYRSLFKKQVLECPLEHITNVSYSTSGLFSSLLNFGNVEVRATGLDRPLEFLHLRHPEQIKDFLWALHIHGPDSTSLPKDPD